MRAVSCHQDVRACRNHPGTGTAPQSGSSRSSLRNTHRVDREPQCRATLRALENSGLDYETIDISTDEQARDFVMSLGHLFSLGFATVSMADQRIVGAPDAARCACGVRSPPPVVELIQ
jgi:hypothetical protein